MAERLKERNLKEEFGQERYEGSYNQDHQRHGKGILVTPEYRYEGDWENGEKQGQGTLTDREGNVYTGEWRNNKRHGEGSLIQKHTYGMFVERYKGRFFEDKKDGKGVLEIKNGTIYEGDFKEDTFNGQGKLRDDKTNYSYDGTFVDGRCQGQGTESYPDGSSYTGQFHHGYKHGQGVLTINKFNYRYQGSWRFGVQQGYGIENFKPVNPTSPDFNSKSKCKKRSDKTSLYEGEFWNNERHGSGLELMENGDFYYGNWVFGKKKGLGFDFSFFTKKWTLSLYKIDKEGKNHKKEIIDSTDPNIPEVWSGYFEILQKIHGAGGVRYKDTIFESKYENYYYLDREALEKHNIDVTVIRFVNMSDIYPQMTVKPYPVHFAYLVKNCDQS